MKARPTLTVITVFLLSMQMYFNRYLSFFVREISVSLFGILNVTKTMDCILIS